MGTVAPIERQAITYITMTRGYQFKHDSRLCILTKRRYTGIVYEPINTAQQLNNSFVT